MSSIREGASVYRPPLLDGTNYAYWKARMSAFIRSIDESAWESIEEGWSRPCDDKGKIILKSNWTDSERTEAGFNSKALNAIFSAVDINVFKLISTCRTAREAWLILETNFEGTSKVRLQRLQLLTSKFEALKMDESETIGEFNAKLRDISNECYALGEKLCEEKLVRKVLRSLPRRFDYKVTAIEEAKDITVLKLDELIGSLITFEMGFREDDLVKRKEIAFAAESKVAESGNGLQKELLETVALITKNFSKMLKGYNRRNYGNHNARDNQRDRSSDSSHQRQKKIQCHECQGYGHIQAECANTLKKKNKSYVTTLSDSDSDGNTSDDGGKDTHIAFNTVLSKKEETESDDPLEIGEESDSEEVTEQTFNMSLSNLQNRLSTIINVNQDLIERVDELTVERDVLKNRNLELQLELDQARGITSETSGELLHLKKFVRMMNSGTLQLDEIIKSGRAAGDISGIGFNKLKTESSMHNDTSSSRQEVENKKTGEYLESNKRIPTQHTRFVPICHYCDKKGLSDQGVKSTTETSNE